MDPSRRSAGSRLVDIGAFSFLLAFVSLSAPSGGSAEPGGNAAREAETARDGDPAPDLVRRLYEEGSWTARLSSFYMRSETVSTEMTRTQTAGTHPGAEASQGSTAKAVAEFGFDARRLRAQWRSEDGAITITLWDGREGIQYFGTKGHESYELCKDTGYWGWLDIWGQHAWARIGGYSFWWHPRDSRAFLAANSLLPEDFASVGRENFAGTECHAVESAGGFLRLYLGVADRRLRGMVKYAPGGGVDSMKVLRAIGGEKIKAAADWAPWLASLQRAERRGAEKAYFDGVARKYHEYTFEDYRQLGPGRWVPWKVRVYVYDIRAGSSSVPRSTSVTTLLEVKADEPLPDDFFRLQMKEGVPVSDYRFDLPEERPITYAYEAGRTEAEFRALHEAARKDLGKLQNAYAGLTAGVAARVGRKPCALPRGTWLNSRPLAWKDLEGKVVVLEFWAKDCAPCLGDFEVFGKDLGTFAEAGVTTIGVHTATTDPRGVEEAVEAHGISIPVCIDAPGPEGKSFGAMTAWFGIDGASQKRYPYLGGRGAIRIPYAVVVGKHGRVAAHGYLWEMLERARELAAAPDGGGGAPPTAVDGDDADLVPFPPLPPASEEGAHRAPPSRR